MWSLEIAISHNFPGFVVLCLEIVENIDQMYESTFSFWNEPDDVITCSHVAQIAIFRF